jgi:hypothetical protein
MRRPALLSQSETFGFSVQSARNLAAQYALEGGEFPVLGGSKLRERAAQLAALEFQIVAVGAGGEPSHQSLPAGGTWEGSAHARLTSVRSFCRQCKHLGCSRRRVLHRNVPPLSQLDEASRLYTSRVNESRSFVCDVDDLLLEAARGMGFFERRFVPLEHDQSLLVP